MKKTMSKSCTSLARQDANRQALLAVMLMAVIPALVFFYLGLVMGSSDEHVSFFQQMIVLGMVIMTALCGFFILRKYPRNIIKLREYVAAMAEGTLPDEVVLQNSQSSDDIQFIEVGFNAILQEMKDRIATIQNKYDVERELRTTIEQQQQALLEAERHRAMIQSLGAACHHIGQPATVLRMHLYLLKEQIDSEQVRRELEDCLKDVEAISDVLSRLMVVSEYRTVPYVGTGEDDAGPDEILAIDG